MSLITTSLINIIHKASKIFDGAERAGIIYCDFEKPLIQWITQNCLINNIESQVPICQELFEIISDRKQTTFRNGSIFPGKKNKICA